MPEQDQPSPEYVVGFNQGWLMQQFEPQLTDKITPALSDSERSQGFKAGRDEFLLEKEKERYPDWLKQDRISSLDKGDFEKDINTPEKEID